MTYDQRLFPICHFLCILNFNVLVQWLLRKHFVHKKLGRFTDIQQFFFKNKRPLSCQEPGCASHSHLVEPGREPKSCLGQVSNSKLGHIAILCSKCMVWHAADPRVENWAQGSSCQLKFSHGWTHRDYRNTCRQHTCTAWLCMQ